MAAKTTNIARILSRSNSANVFLKNDRVQHALAYAQEVYGDEIHRTGMTIFEHALGVLEYLMPFEPDEDAVIASILHHVVFKNGVTLVGLEEEFGATVRSLVSGVHLLSSITLEQKRNSIDDLRLMMLSVSEDVRTILISLCDHAYILNHTETMSSSEARMLAGDALRLYAPVAARLGIYSLKHELERCAFPICYSSDAERITEQLQLVHEQTGDFLKEAAAHLRQYLMTHNIGVRIEHREKEPYSIFRKMTFKGLSSIRDVYDLFAVRIITDSPEDCYSSLGLIHQVGRPLSNRFKDYIAFPKPNGYQSLHTTLVQLPDVPEDTAVEAQVRTHKMHREAQYGIAAHWSYKEFGATQRAMEQTQLKKMLSMQESVQKESGEATLVDHIFVLTPRGDIVELPEGATPLDFAFQVHTDLGLSFRSAKVNGAIVALDHELENGDVIEVLKYRTPKPSPQWMQMLKMSSSRSKLKRHLYAQRRNEFVAKGREMLNQELAKRSIPPLDTDLTLLKVYDDGVLSFARREDLLMKVGQKSQSATSLFPHIAALRGYAIIKTHPRRTVSRQQRKDAVVEVEGGVPMPIRFAKCCKPNSSTKGDIIGIINREGEVMVHRATCHMQKNANPERKINIWWKK
ncbi:MAG: HD domain-containing protein [Candidatus Peribacteraceae bacterium]